jgi:hypothetical protein
MLDALYIIDQEFRILFHKTMVRTLIGFDRPGTEVHCLGKHGNLI